MEGSAGLLRAGSWQAHGEAILLKSTSDVMLQMALQAPKPHRLATEGYGDGGKTNSVDSSSTAAGPEPGMLLVDSATAGLLGPLRQISLDVLAATELTRTKTLASSGGERQNIFLDVFEQLAGKDDLPPLQAGQLYTLPSMQFLESMLSDFDKTATSAGAPPHNLHISGPLDLPGDAFDLPDFSSKALQQQPGPLSAARPALFDQQQPAGAVQTAAASCHVPQPHPSCPGFIPTGGPCPASLQAQLASSMHSTASLALQASMRVHSAHEVSRLMPASLAAQQQMLVLQQKAALATAAAARRPSTSSAASAGVRQPAVPQPAQPRATPRRSSQAYADFSYEEAQVSLQTSKSGRVRKVASFTGVKRKLDVAADANTVSESRDSHGSMGPDVSSGEVGSRGSKGPRKATGPTKNRKGRRTVCLNCGCQQTPQWRCGPLGPRTLCNACGVRYKKDLPLNCWPIRDGMVLPPGALLPPGFVVPPGITIHTQPADFE